MEKLNLYICERVTKEETEVALISAQTERVASAIFVVRYAPSKEMYSEWRPTRIIKLENVVHTSDREAILFHKRSPVCQGSIQE